MSVEMGKGVRMDGLRRTCMGMDGWVEMWMGIEGKFEIGQGATPKEREQAQSSSHPIAPSNLLLVSALYVSSPFSICSRTYSTLPTDQKSGVGRKTSAPL
eukprot:2266591-Rhodomonas_salina.1